MRNIFCNVEDTLAQTFEENPKIMRKGKEVEIQSYVKDFKDDYEVYSLLEKYGSIEKIPMDSQIIEADLSEIKDLRSLKDAEIRAEKAWKDLPLEIRKEFGNNINEFRQNGLKYFKDLNKRIADEEKARQKAIEQAQQITTSTGENS